MLDFRTIEAAILKPVKSRSSRKTGFVDYRTDPRPLRKINTTKTMRRACQYDWLHASIFGTVSIDDTIKKAQKSQEITRGYYFITLTIDRSRSGLVAYEGKGVKIDRWWTLLMSALETPCSRARKKGLEATVSPFCAQMDLDLSGWVHMHLLIAVRTEFEASTLKKALQWWRNEHGDVDCQVVDSQVGVLKCLQYLFRSKSWHESLPNNPQFEEISKRRDLGAVSARNLPKVTEIRIVATQETARQIINPRYTTANGNPMILPRIGPVAQITSLNDLADPEIEDSLMKLTPQGPATVLSAYIETVLTGLQDVGWKQVMIDRFLNPGLVSSFVRIMHRGGWRRAIRFLRKQASFTNMRYAYDVTDTLRSFGKTCGIEVRNSLGEIRTIIDLDVAPIVGVRALSYDELRAKIDARNVA